MTNLKNIGMFIDADNAPARKISQIFAELTRYGNVNIRKAYGNWRSQNLNGWAAEVNDYAIQTVQQFDLTKGKNATDMALVIDVMDILHSKNIDIICLISSDCDFTPLATRIRADGKIVIGFGEKKTPSAFVNICNTFIYLDEENSLESTGSKNCNSNEHMPDFDLLRYVVDKAKGKNGWADLSLVGRYLTGYEYFNYKNIGYKTLGDLFKSIDIFDTQTVEKKGLQVRNNC